MRIHYSRDVDALYIRLRETDIADSDEVAEDIIVDYDSNGKVVGIEIISASSKADVQKLVIQAFDTVTVERPVNA
jgi:uncharacterized protein YuzE